jgi:hypothetical protein
LALSVNYPTPVWVNGFQCRNCTDVDLAKKHIDPAHPKSGPFGVDAKSDPTRLAQQSITLSGMLTGMASTARGPAAVPAPATGGLLDLSA